MVNYTVLGRELLEGAATQALIDEATESLRAEIERAWQYIESCFGVSRERGKTLANALGVLDSRLAKESRVNDAVRAEIEECLKFIRQLAATDCGCDPCRGQCDVGAASLMRDAASDFLKGRETTKDKSHE